ncbi:MAG: acyltransferase [Spirochaetota bacterium]|nr:acyltransferase [Spirochaetota bacterium]
MRLSSIINSPNFKNNNFDFIRFIASFFVILSHSFPLSYGNNQNEPLRLLTGNVTLGSVGVYIFFIISGFLITISFVRSKNLLIYFINRILRIYPAVILVVLLTVFVFGPILTQYSISEYFSNTQTYKYLFTATVFDVRYNLPGVYKNNPFSSTLNGSLWTLRFELVMYIAVAIFGLIGILKGRIITIFVILSTIVAALIKYYTSSINGILFFLQSFLGI